MQYFFLNGRHIRDRALQHALGEAYRGLLHDGPLPDRLPELHMPPEAVDVNVHPTKLEVRFQDAGRLYSQLLATLRGKFLTSDLSTPVQAVPEDSTHGHDEARTAQLRQELVDWAKGKVAAWQPPAGAPAAVPSEASAWRQGVFSASETPPAAPHHAPLALTTLARGRPLPEMDACAQPTPPSPEGGHRRSWRPAARYRSTTATWWPKPRTA